MRHNLYLPDFPLVRLIAASLLILATLAGCATPDDTQPEREHDPLTLWYPAPAQGWNQALPVGNGRLGAMIFGGTGREELQLNEDTLWAGGPNNNVNPEAADAIEPIVDLIFEGRHIEAQAIADEALLSTNNGMPYQTVGSLLLDFEGHERAEDYRRDLDIGRALASVRYRVDGVTYTREVFAPLTGDAIIVRLSADQPGMISTRLGFASPMAHEVSTSEHQLRIEGRGSDHEGVTGRVRFTTLIQPVLEGGQLSHSDEALAIEGADAVTLHIATATNFNNYQDVSGDARARASEQLQASLDTGWESLRRSHVEAYKEQFDRVSLDLGSSDAARQPTDQRIANFARQHDPEMAALYFQFGRYLLISSSQPGTQPANLQGLWNRHTHPAWDSKYTLNINAEMNYWPAELTNLSELHEPFFGLIEDLSHTGQESARTLYGADGWMVHHNTDIWRITGLVDWAFYGQWLGAGAWLTQHLGYRWDFTGNEDDLARHYPIMREAARFYADVLRREPEHGWLVLAPSNSPENDYRHDSEEQASIAAGTTMDNQLVFDLFSRVIDAATRLDKDPELVRELRIKRAQLPPMQIGQHGQLQEWLHDWDDPDDEHRHVSHLYGLHPGNQISPYRTPALFEAARTSMEQRGDASTGWSMGWKINLWARLLDGDRAYQLLRNQIALVTEDAVTESGGTYANMLCAHPPFQIDGNFGVTAGVAEMLVQSHDGVIHLLPALPEAWPDGRVSGLTLRGGFVLDMAWADGAVTEVTLHSRLGGHARLRVHGELQPDAGLSVESISAGAPNPNPFYQVPHIADPLIAEGAPVGEPALRPSTLLGFETRAGERYRLTAP